MLPHADDPNAKQSFARTASFIRQTGYELLRYPTLATKGSTCSLDFRVSISTIVRTCMYMLIVHAHWF